jgi:hypothetical protein
VKAGRRAVLLCWVFLSLTACAATGAQRNPDKTKGESRPVTQVELQQDLERFTGDLLSRLADSAEPMVRGKPADERDPALRQLLAYESAALDISTGPIPEISLLDMVVFLELSRGVFARHWLGIFGEESRPVLEAFDASRARLSKIVSKVLTPAQQQRLYARIEEWVKQNPERLEVETVRFSEFSELAGRISQKDADETRGLLGSVRGVTKSADAAVLLGERMRFLVLRLPYVVRLHARLGVSQMTTDGFERLGDVEQSFEKVSQTRPLVNDLTALASESRLTVSEARATLNELGPIVDRLPSSDQLQRLLGAAEGMNDKTLRLLDRLSQVLGEAKALLPSDSGESRLAKAEQHLDGLMRRAVLYLIAIGAAWSLLFWGGYWAAKTLTRPRRPGRRGPGFSGALALKGRH